MKPNLVPTGLFPVDEKLLKRAFTHYSIQLLYTFLGKCAQGCILKNHTIKSEQRIGEEERSI